jgi:Zinc carboxypeptidase
MKALNRSRPIRTTRSGSRLALEGREIIGYSRQGRPLAVELGGDPAASQRILIIAGQHGDESDGRHAAATYLAEMQPASASIAVLCDCNPDGAALATRRNAAGADLNRDHLLLLEPETAALHKFVRRWQPHLVIDVHTYRSWRPELLKHNLVFAQDVMIDFPTNPAARSDWSDELDEGLLQRMTRHMAHRGYSCDRYTLVRPPGMVRHSTVDIIDARNSLALRYGAYAVLIEGKRSTADDPDASSQSSGVIREAIQVAVDWAQQNAGILERHRSALKQRRKFIPVACRYEGAGLRIRRMRMQSATTGDIRWRELPGEYLSLVRVTRKIDPPRAYAVQRCASPLLRALQRQGIRTIPSSVLKGSPVDVFEVIAAPTAAGNEDYWHPPQIACRREYVNPDQYVVFDADQPGLGALCLLVDPASQFGAHRFHELRLNLKPGALYPIARCK